MNSTLPQTITELHAQLEAAGCGQGQDVRKHLPGQCGHQGDIYLHPIKERPACWNVETTDQSRQVAIGAEEGSHHCATGDIRIFWPDSLDNAVRECPVADFFAGEPEARRVCIGPIIEAKGPLTVTHPKHAHHEFPAGLYLTTYQLDRRTMRQVQD